MNVRSISFVLITLLCGVAASAATWSIQTAHFATVEGEIKSVDEKGVGVSIPEKGDTTLSWDEFLQASRPLPSKAAGKFVIELAGGDRINGEPAGVSGEKLKWRSGLLEEMTIPLTRIVAITKSNQPPAAHDQKRTEDSVALTNGDKVAGIISDVTESAIVVQSNGNPISVPLDSVTAAYFASAGGANSASERGIRLKLTDESVVTGKSIRLEDNLLVLSLDANDSRKIDLASVAGIEQVNGPVSWLSSRTPIENVQTPYFEAAFPAKMNLSVTGKPIRFGDRTFARGIGVHSASKMVWELDGAYSTFRTQYAIDGDGAFANVTVRIKLDDKIIHEKSDVVAGEMSPVISIPLAGAKKLTLEVDYGKTYDTQDRFNWIEPALVKSAPTIQP